MSIDVECWCGNTPPPATLFHTELEKKCTFSCPGDTKQACGGNGGYISVFYNVLRYTPPNSTTVTGVSATSTTSSTSSTSTLTTTATSRSTTTTSITSTTTSSSSSTTTSTGPTVVPTAGNFASLGCYTEATGMRALTGSTFANDTMTVELCAAFCAGFTFMGVEYHRECKLCLIPSLYLRLTQK